MLLAIWDDGVWQDAARIAVIALVAYALVLWVGALVWTYRDVSSRTRDPFTHGIALVLVVVFNLPGLLLYLILRPKETLADAYDRRLEAEALLQEIQEQATCPACRRKVESDFVACPYCRTTLRTPCASCGKPMSSTWVLCPFCGVDRVPATASAPSQDRGRSQPTAPPQLIADDARIKRASTARYTPPAPATQPPTPAAVTQPESGAEAAP